MGTRTAEVNWQQSAQRFQVGDVVRLLGGHRDDVGRVVAVWPAIGMLDLQFSSGWVRRPVEEVQLLNPENVDVVPPPLAHAKIPGGVKKAPVSAGPPEDPMTKASRVAEAFMQKSALYWAARDRQYRATKGELDSGIFECPKCHGPLQKSRYKRREGRSERLLACRDCLFLVKPEDCGLEGC